MELRDGLPYVYEARWEGGRAVRRYLGTGPELLALARQAEADRAEARRQREAEHQELAAHARQAQEADAGLEALEELVAAALAAHGLHRPDRGRLRRRHRAPEAA